MISGSVWRIDEENGVSAIIGVMLMVVITVVLAACVAVFSFNLTDHTPNTNIVGVQVTRIDSTHIIVKYMGGLDNNVLLYDEPGIPNAHTGITPTGCYGSFNITVDGHEISNFVPVGTTTCTSTIGSIQRFSPVPEGSEVSVIINYLDGTKYIGWDGVI